MAPTVPEPKRDDHQRIPSAVWEIAAELATAIGSSIEFADAIELVRQRDILDDFYDNDARRVDFAALAIAVLFVDESEESHYRAMQILDSIAECDDPTGSVRASIPRVVDLYLDWMFDGERHSRAESIVYVAEEFADGRMALLVERVFGAHPRGHIAVRGEAARSILSTYLNDIERWRHENWHETLCTSLASHDSAIELLEYWHSVGELARKKTRRRRARRVARTEGEKFRDLLDDVLFQCGARRS